LKNCRPAPASKDTSLAVGRQLLTRAFHAVGEDGEAASRVARRGDVRTYMITPTPSVVLYYKSLTLKLLLSLSRPRSAAGTVSNGVCGQLGALSGREILIFYRQRHRVPAYPTPAAHQKDFPACEQKKRDETNVRNEFESGHHHKWFFTIAATSSSSNLVVNGGVVKLLRTVKKKCARVEMKHAAHHRRHHSTHGHERINSKSHI